MKTVQIEYKGIDLLVSGYYTPGENEITYDSDMGGSPAYGSEFEIETIKLLDSDIDILSLLENDLDDIVELCIGTVKA